MSLLRQIVPSLIFKSLKSPWQLCCFNPRPGTSHLIHTVTKPTAPNNVVKAICNAFRSGWTWDTLSREFHHIEFNEQLIEKILLELKQPIDAKWALGFFHWAAHRVNFQHCLRSYCLAIHILVRARLNLDARALIEAVLKKNAGDSSKFLVVDSLLSCYKITDSNPFVFDLLVQSYSRLRMFDSGFDVCCYLEEHGFSLNLVSFNTFIHFVEKSDENTMVWRIYEHMIWRRIYPNQSTIRTLISSLCKEGKLQKYVEMLDRIHGRRCSPSVIVNTSLVFKIFEEGRVEEGVVLLKRMLQRNMLFDTIAYSLIVYAKLKLGNIVSAQDVYEEMLKRGFRANPFVYTLFIGAYCKEGRIDEAHCMMKDMEDMGLKPYEETFNSLVECYANAGRLEESLRNCEIMMEKGFVPSSAAFNEMVHKLCENGEAEKANAMLTRLLEKGFSPNDITYASLIVGYEKKGDVEEVLKLFYEMESKSISPGSSVFTTLIRSLCRSGKLEQAKKYLRIMKDRKIVLLQSVSTKGRLQVSNLMRQPADTPAAWEHPLSVKCPTEPHPQLLASLAMCMSRNIYCIRHVTMKFGYRISTPMSGFKGYLTKRFKNPLRGCVCSLIGKQETNSASTSDALLNVHTIKFDRAMKFAEFVSCLPIKEYTHPLNGFLNLSVKLSLKLDMGVEIQ